MQKSIPYVWPKWRQNGYNRYPIYDLLGRIYLYSTYKGVPRPRAFEIAFEKFLMALGFCTSHYITLTLVPEAIYRGSEERSM